MRLLTHPLVSLNIVAIFCACGGSTPEPESGDSNESEPAEAAEPAPAAQVDTEPEQVVEEEAASESTSSKPDRSPKQVLTGGEDVLFVFSFNASEAYQAAEKECAEKSGDDPQKNAECLSKASKKFEVDGFHFKQDDEGNWWWLTLRRKGNQLVTLHKIQVEFGKETDDSITLKTVGPDKGTRPMARVPTEVVLEIPSSSEIVVNDPKHGKMVYQAKMGLLGEAKR